MEQVGSKHNNIMFTFETTDLVIVVSKKLISKYSKTFKAMFKRTNIAVINNTIPLGCSGIDELAFIGLLTIIKNNENLIVTAPGDKSLKSIIKHYKLSDKIVEYSQKTTPRPVRGENDSVNGGEHNTSALILSSTRTKTTSLSIRRRFNGIDSLIRLNRTQDAFAKHASETDYTKIALQSSNMRRERLNERKKVQREERTRLSARQQRINQFEQNAYTDPTKEGIEPEDIARKVSQTLVNRDQRDKELRKKRNAHNRNRVKKAGISFEELLFGPQH